MINLIKIGNTYNIPIKEYEVDSTSELANLPSAPVGSIVTDLSTGKRYKFNSSGEWAIEKGSSSGGDSSLPEPGTAGNVLTSTGDGWESAPLPGGDTYETVAEIAVGTMEQMQELSGFYAYDESDVSAPTLINDETYYFNDSEMSSTLVDVGVEYVTLRFNASAGDELPTRVNPNEPLYVFQWDLEDGTLLVVSDANEIENTTVTILKKVSGSSALPSMTGQSGKFLTNNGTTASWATISGGSGDLVIATATLTINQETEVPELSNISMTAAQVKEAAISNKQVILIAQTSGSVDKLVGCLSLVEIMESTCYFNGVIGDESITVEYSSLGADVYVESLDGDGGSSDECYIYMTYDRRTDPSDPTLTVTSTVSEILAAINTGNPMIKASILEPYNEEMGITPTYNITMPCSYFTAEITEDEETHTFIGFSGIQITESESSSISIAQFSSGLMDGTLLNGDAAIKSYPQLPKIHNGDTGKIVGVDEYGAYALVYPGAINKVYAELTESGGTYSVSKSVKELVEAHVAKKEVIVTFEMGSFTVEFHVSAYVYDTANDVYSIQLSTTIFDAPDQMTTIAIFGNRVNESTDNWSGGSTS